MAMTGSAIVTGGAGDIGLAIAKRLHADGWKLGLIDLDRDAVAQAAAQISNAVGLVADVTDEASCEVAVAGFGAVDLLVNNAGIGRFGALHELSTADFRKVLEVNLVGAYIMAKAVAKGMLARGRGIISQHHVGQCLDAGTGSGRLSGGKSRSGQIDRADGAGVGTARRQGEFGCSGLHRWRHFDALLQGSGGTRLAQQCGADTSSRPVRGHRRGRSLSGIRSGVLHQRSSARRRRRRGAERLACNCRASRRSRKRRRCCAI